MDPKREVFPNAPLAMVVAEIQFSYLQELNSEATMAQALDRVRMFTPVIKASRKDTVDFQVGGDSASATHQSTGMMEASALDRQTTAAITAQTLAVAMSGVAYTQYEQSLRPLIEAAYSGLVDVVPGVIVTRLGLRYLDEVRVPDASADVSSWRRWVAPELLGGAGYLTKLSGVAVGVRSTWQYLLPGDRQVVLTYGPFRGSGVVGPDHPFHKAGPDSLMFVLDLDTSWTPHGGAASLACEDLTSQYDELHQPGQAVFAAAVTDEARELFRGGRS